MKKSVRDIDVAGKRVLMRGDLNVPFDKEGEIVDDSRIRAVVPTIVFLREQGARVIICSHRGRPDGKVVESLRLAPIAKRLSDLLGVHVIAARECVGPEVEAAAKALAPGDVMLLENVRFHPEEEANDPEFAKALASLADVYVNDAFGTAHRAHASTVGVTEYLPSVAGLLTLKELEEMGNVLGNPARPMAAILGGAKISSKIGVLQNLLPRVDKLILGGGIATTFLKSRGFEVGDSLVEADYIETARQISEEAESRGVEILLPVDAVVADAFDANANKQTVQADAIPAGWRMLDVGPATVSLYTAALSNCSTIFWNGPLGVAEFPAFAEGSNALAKALAGINARVVIGGGETAAIVEDLGLRDKYTHVSTGGGASLEFIEGRVLPGIAALQDK